MTISLLVAHDNSRFGGVAVVVPSRTRGLETSTFVQADRGLIGGPDFQEPVAGGGQDVGEEGSGKASAARAGVDGKVENFVFPRRDLPGDDESDHF